MYKIPNTNLYIGTELDIEEYMNNNEFSIVNVANGLHSVVLGYKPKQSDPNYVLYKKDSILSANFVDSNKPEYYNWESGGISVFTQILDFIENQKNKDILVNCNQGMSRSPSIVMLYLAKRLKKINDKSFKLASLDFIKIYPNYNPGLGIKLFLTENWESIK